ncbi:MAG TPA: pentapeptide repeat-containing protein, partial [Phototrophicaceae bacterium]|nr:pentapeptide repeat-containing protein [Phototrophicaceae bacterium]
GHTSFYMAHAQRAEMSSISLQHSDFSESDFHGANLQHADLRQSLMQDTNFARANLEQANLSGAKMVNTNFSEANLSGAHFDKTTILPDAKFIRHGENYTPVYDNYWTPDTDMNRYTDPHHAYFWQPAWA